MDEKLVEVILKTKKAMISQPMNGKSNDEIKLVREKAIKVLEDKGFIVVNTFFQDEWANQEKMKEDGVIEIPVAFLARSLEVMSHCSAVYFCNGWSQARGCKFEHDITLAYGIERIYEAAVDYGIEYFWNLG